MKSLSSISLFIVGLCAACGLGHKDPKTLADAMAVAAIAQGFLALEAPELNLRLYGTKDQSLYTQAFSRYLGASILSIGIISLCMFTIGLEVKLALGWSLVVWTGTHAQALLNQIPAKMGLSPVGQSLWLIHCVLCIYACFTNANYSENLLTTAYALSAVLSTVAIVAPKSFAKLYGGGHEVAKLNDDQFGPRLVFVIYLLDCRVVITRNSFHELPFHILFVGLWLREPSNVCACISSIKWHRTPSGTRIHESSSHSSLHSTIVWTHRVRQSWICIGIRLDFISWSQLCSSGTCRTL